MCVVMLWWEAIGNKVYADEPLYSALHALNRETVYARGAFQTTVPSLGWEGNAMRPARDLYSSSNANLADFTHEVLFHAT
jgi:hypothetical protein